MRCRLLWSLFFSLLAVPLFSQRTLQDTDENKYRILLPDHWSNHSKAFHVLTDVLPALCPELKDKDICGDDCNPAWTVAFYLSEPELLSYQVYPRNSPITNTNTRSSFVSKDFYISPASPQPRQETGNNLIYRQPNTNTTGKEIVSYFTFQCFLLLRDKEQNIVTRLILVDTNEVWQKVQANRKGNTPEDASGKTNPLLPSAKDLMAIADKKIIALGKGE